MDGNSNPSSAGRALSPRFARGDRMKGPFKRPARSLRLDPVGRGATIQDDTATIMGHGHRKSPPSVFCRRLKKTGPGRSRRWTDGLPPLKR